MFKKMMYNPWEAKIWFYPDDDDDLPPDDGDETEDGDEATEEEGDDDDDEEFETEFEAKLAKEHPELLKEYRDATGGLVSALRKERGDAKTGRKAQKELKAYKDKEEEEARKTRSKEENLEADLAAERKAREKAETELQASKRERLVTSVAAELGFNDPDDAVSFVSKDVVSSLEDFGDDDKKAVKKDLEGILKKKPYLASAEEDLEDKGNRFDRKRRKLDDDPDTKKKIKSKQPTIPI